MTEGETASQISECMEVVLQAVITSSVPTRDQILWLIDCHLSDEYGLLDDAEKHFAQLKDKQSWSAVADSLLGRLEGMPRVNKKTDFSSSYHRTSIMNWAIEALERSGRPKEIIPLLEREAPINQCYGTLVDRLLSAKRVAEAKAVAVEGFRQTVNSASGIAWDLESKLVMMAEFEKDLPLVAAYRSLEFFDRPSLDSFKTFKKAAKASGQWSACREAVIGFLETGARPDVQEAEARSNKKAKGAESWPLPRTEISEFSGRPERRYFRHSDTLLRIAIHEKDSNEILRRFNMEKNSRIFDESVRDEVAESLKKSHPDFSLEIWRNLAEEQIRLVKPAAYEVAARYLRRMRDVYENTHRFDEWSNLIKSIRAEHKPKRSLMQILDTLEAKRIVDA